MTGNKADIHAYCTMSETCFSRYRTSAIGSGQTPRQESRHQSNSYYRTESRILTPEWYCPKKIDDNADQAGKAVCYRSFHNDKHKNVFGCDSCHSQIHLKGYGITAQNRTW